MRSAQGGRRKADEKCNEPPGGRGLVAGLVDPQGGLGVHKGRLATQHPNGIAFCTTMKPRVVSSSMNANNT